MTSRWSEQMLNTVKHLETKEKTDSDHRYICHLSPCPLFILDREKSDKHVWKRTGLSLSRPGCCIGRVRLSLLLIWYDTNWNLILWEAHKSCVYGVESCTEPEKASVFRCSIFVLYFMMLPQPFIHIHPQLLDTTTPHALRFSLRTMFTTAITVGANTWMCTFIWCSPDEAIMLHTQQILYKRGSRERWRDACLRLVIAVILWRKSIKKHCKEHKRPSEQHFLFVWLFVFECNVM